jgi:hypothetical protein
MRPLLLFLAVLAIAQDKTKIALPYLKTQLVGQHKFRLQWVDFNPTGVATVTDDKGLLRLTARQKNNKGDWVELDGIILNVSEREFVLRGKARHQVSHINAGKPCEREGTLTFAIKASRPWWRMQEMDSPCDGLTDYYDVFVK